MDSLEVPSRLVGLEKFSTRGLSSESRVELWEEHNAKALVGLECRTLTDSPLEATETNLQLTSLQFAHVAANPHVVERTSRHINQKPTDGVVLYFTLQGESFFYYRDGVHLQQPGGLLVCDVNEPFMRGFAQGLQEFALRVPRALFDEISDSPIPKRPMTMSFAGGPTNNAHAAALAALVRSAFGDPAGDDLIEVEAMAVGLLRAMFSEDGARSGAAHRRNALAFLDQHLADPRLSVSRIARSIGLSERQLSRVFSESESGLARLIVDRRLDRARHLLTSRDETLSIGEIAASCGFSSHAHFARVFRTRFGETPSDARERTLRDRVS